MVQSGRTTPTLPSSTTEHLTASVATTTIDNATAESTTTKPSTTHAETTFSQPTTESRTTTAAVNSTVTENSNLTTGSPDVSPSAPTSGTTVSTSIQETSQPTKTMTGHTTLTHSTEPASGNTTASSTTTPTSTTTISTGTIITGTTSTTTITTGTTITGTTQQPTDVTTNNSTTAPTSTTTISTGTTITGTTQRPTDVTTNNSTTTISTGTTITGTTQRPTDVTTNNSTTTPTSTTTISTGTTITGTTQRPTDVTTNNSTISTGTTTTATTAAPPIPPVCPTVPCPPERECLDGTCQCLSGSFLVDGRCAPAQVFSGQLHLVSLTFEKEMSNRSSRIFQETAAQISAVLRDALKNQPGYIQSDVVQLKQGSVQAIVNNIFDNTTATQDSVDEAITEAIADLGNALFANATFTGTSLCDQDPLPCDVFTTKCTNSNGRASCSCKAGYINILYSNTSCRACPSGWRAVGNMCKPCAFGYAGFNCNDSSLLAMVVISCVLGGVLLIIVLALLIYYCWRGCTKSKSDYSSSPYSSGDLNQPWPTGITPIPRATTKWNAAPPIEMSEGGSTRVLVDKKPQTNGLGFQPNHTGWKKSGSYDLNPEGMNTFKGQNSSRYSYLVQGHENPYFLPGDGKKD
ncbi:protein HEG homolog 1 [Anarhichas minor]|uniref:protein HEG homolog 1 n=1 Tax=Anarhichas minor TaxID=65739 RepID=UPI003F739247